jgi:hypothetical protein
LFSKSKIVKIGRIGSFSESTSDMVNDIELWVYVLGRKGFESLAYSVYFAYSAYDSGHMIINKRIKLFQKSK